MSDQEEEDMMLTCHPSTANSKCPLCDTNLLGIGHLLQQCGHILCRLCLVEAINRAGATFLVSCPLRDIGIPCEGYLMLEEIQQVLSPNEFSAWEISSGYKKPEPSTTMNFSAPSTSSSSSSSSSSTMKVDNRSSYNHNNSMDEEVFSIMFYSDSATCSFCFVELPPLVGILLQSCLHVFCSDCLRNCIRNSEGGPVNCPECQEALYDREIKALATEADYIEYQRKSLQKATQDMPIFRCTTNGCEGFCIVDAENQGSKVFLCPCCNVQNCLACQAAHGGITCEKYQELREKANRSGVNPTDQELVESETNFASKQINRLVGEFLNGVPKDDLATYYACANQLVETLKVIETGEEFECAICTRMNSETAKGGIILSQCNHTFCRECLEEIVKLAERIPVPCPNVDGNGNCTEFLTQAEFRALASPEVLDKHERWGFKIAQDIIEKKFSCLGRNCEAFWEVAEGNEYSIYICPVCQEKNCVRCNAIHTNATCDDYQEHLRLELEKQKDDANRIVQMNNEKMSEQEVEKMLAARRFMRCPWCRFICEKISGCNHVVCLNRACAKSFNWIP